MSNGKRILALLLCIGMILVLFTSSAYIAHEADHKCAGEDCEICKTIEKMEALMQSFALLGVLLLVLFSLLSIRRAYRAAAASRVFHAPTLVSWKVRLND